MKDIHLPTRELYYDLITGAGYKCYEAEAIPEDASTPYIMIINVATQELSNKTNFGNTVQITLDIVAKYNKNKIVGSKQVDLIAGDILGLINSKTKLEISNGLQIVSTKIIQDQKRSETTGSHKIFKRLIRFQHLIMEI